MCSQSMPPAGFELTTTATQWPQTDTLDRTAHEIGLDYIL